MAERIEILHRTYPDLIYAVTRNTLRTTSNRLIVIDDEVEKRHHVKFTNADIEDQLSQVYPVGRCYRGRRRDVDPGQMRSRDFLRLAYGANETAVMRGSTMIEWFGQRIRFSKRHGAARALRHVLAELEQLPEKFHDVLKPIGRTIDWEPEENGSVDVHAYGIAIDLNPAFRDRWRYIGRKKRRVNTFRNRVYPEVIAVFERHGFIWGGKWYHFKTNHFEYRPALIAIGQLALERGCDK